MKSVTTGFALAVLAMLQVCDASDPPPNGFPFVLPKEKPDRALSSAMERNYTAYLAPRPEDNELHSLFKYTELKGLDYNNHDGTITRRDPSKVVFANGKYYLYYQGFMEASGTRGDDCPVAVSYADSPDGPWTPYKEVLSLDLHDPTMKRHRPYVRPDQYFKQGLNQAQRKRIDEANRALRK